MRTVRLFDVFGYKERIELVTFDSRVMATSYVKSDAFNTFLIPGRENNIAEDIDKYVVERVINICETMEDVAQLTLVYRAQDVWNKLSAEEKKVLSEYVALNGAIPST